MVFSVPQRQVAQQGLSSAPIPENRVFASEAAFGGTSARALQSAGGQISQSANTMAAIAQEQQDKADVSLAVDSYNKFRDDWRGQDKGFKSRLGLEAKGVTSEGTKSFDDLSFKMSEQLQGSARTRFQSLVQGSRNSSLDGLSRFEQSQNQAAFENQMNALTETAINDAIDDFQNPAVADNSKLMIDTSIRAMLQGQAPEVIDAAIKEQTSVMQEGIIDRIAGIDVNAANEYFKDNKDDLTAKAIVKVEKSMAIKLSAEQEEELVASKYEKDIPLDEVNQAIQKTNKPQNTKDGAKRRAANRRAVDNAADRQRNETAYQTAFENVKAGNGVETLAPDILAELSQDDIVKLETLSGMVKNGHAPVTDSEALQDLMTLPDEQLAAKDINREYGNRLSDDHFKFALTLQKNARAKLAGTKQSEQMIRAGDYKEALTLAASQAGIIPKDTSVEKLRLTSDNDARRFQNFDIALRKQVDAWLQNNKGKQMTRTDVTEMAQSVLEDTVFVDPGPFTTALEVPVVSLTAADFEKIDEDTIDPIKNSFTGQKLTKLQVSDMLLDLQSGRPITTVSVQQIPKPAIDKIIQFANENRIGFDNEEQANQWAINFYLRSLIDGGE